MAAFVFDVQGRTLMQHRTGSHGASSWCPPGGKMDFGESPENAIAREILEETDLVIKDLEFIGYTNDVFETDQLHFITLWYAARVATGVPRITEPHKCLALEWHTLDSLPQPLFLPTNLILEKDHIKEHLDLYSKEQL